MKKNSKETCLIVKHCKGRILLLDLQIANEKSEAKENSYCEKRMTCSGTPGKGISDDSVEVTTKKESQLNQSCKKKPDEDGVATDSVDERSPDHPVIDFEKEVAALYPWLLCKAKRYSLSFADAEDLAGDTVYRVLANRDKFQNDRPLKPWCLTVMSNIYVCFVDRRNESRICPQLFSRFSGKV